MGSALLPIDCRAKDVDVAAITQVLRLRVALAAVAENGDSLSANAAGFESFS